MRILVCVKRVPAPGARIVLTEDQQAIDTNLLSFTVSPHEECAVEEGVQLAEKHDGTVTVLTLGPPEAEEQLRSALAVGANEAVLIPTGGEDWDPISTASALASAIGELESDQPFDLILFGNESADAGGYQVGIRVARALGRPIVSGIKGIEVEAGSVRLMRDTPTGSEVYELPLPAMVCVKEGINLPRYPTLKGRLNAKKVEVQRLEGDRVGSGQIMVRLITPPQVVSETTILGDGADAAVAVVDLLEELQVVGK
ncbi:MAG TPA: electron transfer flavoprotein subunit beta/FixA family protein [Acidimicrobiia bacterium]|nr:electron transfer flavoprotein subunit beta/FixA family protein [Acidimicrobiia bacterium]